MPIGHAHPLCKGGARLIPTALKVSAAHHRPSPSPIEASHPNAGCANAKYPRSPTAEPLARSLATVNVGWGWQIWPHKTTLLLSEMPQYQSQTQSLSSGPAGKIRNDTRAPASPSHAPSVGGGPATWPPPPNAFNGCLFHPPCLSTDRAPADEAAGAGHLRHPGTVALFLRWSIEGTPVRDLATRSCCRHDRRRHRLHSWHPLRPESHRVRLQARD